MMPNVLQYPIALLGALRAGLVVVNTNPLYTARELRHQLQDSGARAIVVLENFGHVLEECVDDTDVEHVVVTGLGDMLGTPKSLLVNFVVRHVKRMVPPFRIEGAIRWRDALAAGRETPAGEVTIAGDDLAFLQYTGGTTGLSKGAMLTNRNMVACILQMDAFLRPFAREGEDVIVTALPLYHIFALTANCITYMRLGGMNLLITNPRDMKGFVKTLTGARFSVITGVNTLFNGLLNTKGFADLDLLLAAHLGGRRHGGAERGGAPVEGPDRGRVAGGLRAHRDGARSLHESAAHRRLHRHGRRAHAEHRVPRDRRERVRAVGRCARRALHSRPASHGGLLEPAGRDHRGDGRGRVVADRRHRGDRCARIRPHRRPEEGT